MLSFQRTIEVPAQTLADLFLSLGSVSSTRLRGLYIDQDEVNREATLQLTWLRGQSGDLLEERVDERSA